MGRRLHDVPDRRELPLQLGLLSRVALDNQDPTGLFVSHGSRMARLGWPVHPLACAPIALIPLRKSKFCTRDCPCGRSVF